MLDPGRGCSSSTRPFWLWLAVGRLRTATRKPAERRLSAAVAWSWSSTLGTVAAGCGFGPVETFTRTRELRRSEVPAAGTWETALFAGWLERTYVTVGRNPKVLRRRSAGVWARPTTRGTRTREAVVVVVTVAVVADVAFCKTGLRPSRLSVVTADPCVCPTTCGTITGLTPLETFSSTLVPRTAVTPPTGACSTTIPFGREDATRFTSLSNPLVVSSCWASFSGSPTTSGTASRPLEIEIVTV